jgi:exosortase
MGNWLKGFSKARKVQYENEMLFAEDARSDRAAENLQRFRHLSHMLVLNAPWLLLLAYWIHFWNRLRFDWSAEAQYAFGWWVPFLTLGLLCARWQSRPPPRPLRRSFRKVVTVGVILILLLHIPICLVEEANAGWRALLWFREFWLVGLSLALTGLVGGRPSVRHFAFPLCFTAVAVPWPSAWESALTQMLVRGSAAIAVEVLNVAGLPAVRHGNLIEVATGIVGVEEACSGVRGLQTSLMVSLVLGELGRLSFLRRLLLVLAGAAVALLLNLLRAIVLSWLAASQGLVAIDQWHGIAGIVEFGGILAAIALINWLLRPRSIPALQNLTQLGATAGFEPVSLSVSITALLALIGGLTTTAAWYGLHESSFSPTVRWTIQRPSEFSENFPNFVSHPIPDRTRELLRAPEGWSYSWSEPEGLEFRVFFFRSLQLLHRTRYSRSFQRSSEIGKHLATCGGGLRETTHAVSSAPHDGKGR